MVLRRNTLLLHACLAALAGCVQLSGKPAHESGHGASVPGRLRPGDLPAAVREVGLGLFHTEERLASVLERMSPPESVAVEGRELRLVHASGDDTIERIRGDNEDRRLLRQDHGNRSGVIIDVGANVGDFAILAAMLNPRKQIVAVEPVPTTFFYLQYNVHLNGLRNIPVADLGDPDKPGVFLMHAAMGTSDGTSEVGYSDLLSQNAGVNVSRDQAQGWQFESVPQLNFYNFLMGSALFEVDLLKMDCEGCEFCLIPQLGSFFASKKQLHRFTGEIHRSLTDPNEKTFVQKPSQAQISRTDSLLKERGCGATAWAVSC